MPNREHLTTEVEIKEIWERLTAGEASIKSAHKRIDALEKIANSVNELALSTNQIALETKALREDVTNANDKIQSLEGRPAKRYDTIITAIITTVVGGIIGYILNSIF